jgi:hypothetical protein
VRLLAGDALMTERTPVRCPPRAEELQLESGDFMKKSQSEAQAAEDPEMRPEYDFSGGVRGKHYRSMQSGYTVTVHREDGTTLVKEVEPREGTILLDPDIREYFPDSESVNRTLRSLITLVPMKVASTSRKPRRPTSKQKRTPE